MKPFIQPTLIPALPEIFLAVSALVLLVAGVLRRKDDDRNISNFTVFVLLAAGVMLTHFGGEAMATFNNMFVTDSFAVFMKLLVLAGSAMSIIMSARYAEENRIARFEYPVLVLLSTLGMLLMISANNLMSLYMALELQSLPLYVLASMQRDNLRSTEAGVKYFILGALSSGMLLYGASLLYGFAGTVDFNGMAAAFAAAAGEGYPAGLIVGMILLLSGLAFKIAAAPFHMWAPDVYEGAPTSVTAFFAIVPKVAAIALLIRVFMGPFGEMVAEWRQVVIALSIASMVLGSVAAIAQSNIKRMLAYSSIGHMGYALMGLAAASTAGIKAIMIYVAIYVAASIGVFAVVLCMRQKGRMTEKISDLSGLSSRQPLLALVMAILMFSMAGIPPLAGFFGKLFVFQAAIEAQLYTLAIIGVLTSVISAFYYLRIIKVMYFDPQPGEAIDAANDARLNFALILSTTAVVLFITFPAPLLDHAGAAVAAIVQPK